MKKLFVIFAMLIVMNASAQWVQMSNGIMLDRTITCLANNGNNIFAGVFNNSNPNGVYLSTDNGGIWIQSSLNYKQIESICVSGNNIIAGSAFSGLYISTNNGTDWPIRALEDKYIWTLAVNGDFVFAGTDNYPQGTGGVYLSSNNGLNWTQTALTNKEVLSIATKENYIFAGTYNGGGLYVSTNNGANWAQTSLNQRVLSLAISGNNIFAGTKVNGIYRSTNNGLNWTQTSLYQRDVYSLIISGIYIFAGVTETGVQFSSDNGETWVPKNQNWGNKLVYAFLVKDNFIFAGTLYNSVWRRSMSEITGIQNISTETPSKYSLSQNYPNPFNSMCNVQFSMCNAGYVKLVVYDVQGREVRTLVNERLQPGTYEAAFDGSSLNSGVYFYKLIIRHGGSSTIGFTETKKMLLIK